MKQGGGCCRQERRQDMWKCGHCNTEFEFPEIKKPDAGLVFGVGILGLRKMEPVKFCPSCLSTMIKQCGKDY